ncbi:MAG: DUF4231 domain-containing protein [Caldithrix sp.]|nr:MAG: DUF4231 domain-containing protein [Caldithrix sp.]
MEIAQYIEERLTAQQAWYEKKASANKRVFMNNQTTVIILGALIPLIVVFEPVFKMDGWTGPLSAVIAAFIVILTGLDKLNQPQANWFNYRANEEMLKKEEWMYKFKAGPYRGVEPTEIDKVLVERVESVISSDIARFAQAEYKKDKSKDKPLTPPGGKKTTSGQPKKKNQINGG